MKIKRKFTKEFKLAIIHELERGKRIAQICRENDISKSLLYRWRREYTDNPESAFIVPQVSISVF
jgi:transposase